MGGPNLEVFKFAVYVFFPVAMMLHYGDPEWYRRNVLAVRHMPLYTHSTNGAYVSDVMFWTTYPCAFPVQGQNISP